MRSGATRHHDVRVRLRPFGTKGSQVQILSPRPTEGPGTTGFGLWSGPFDFRGSAPRPDRFPKPSGSGTENRAWQAKGERSLQRLPVVRQLAVVVDRSGDLGARVAERLLHGPEVDATASARGASASAESFLARPWRPPFGAWPPRLSALSSSETAPGAAAHRPSRRWRPPSEHRASAPAWASHPRPELPKAHPSKSVARPDAPPADTSRRRPPCRPGSSRRPATVGCALVARPAPRAAAGPALSTPPGPRKKARAPGIDWPPCFARSSMAVDRINRSSASSRIDLAGARH